MYNRFLNVGDSLDEAVFLFGARQTGKSTLLKVQFPDALMFDLLNSDVQRRFRRNPELLREMLQTKQEGTLVIIDEIQKVPELLDEVHWLMTNRGIRFILCGSSARKLKRNTSNTLGGRAVPVYFYPLVSAEIPDFDIYRAMQNGMLPRHYMVENARVRLRGYVDVYLKEEIQQEALVRELDNFSRFLEVAAIMDGEILNYENIASDCGVSAKTIKEYFRILYDTLIGYEIPAYTKSPKRKVMQSPRFYYFDVGIANYLRGKHDLQRGTDDFGHAFEHLVIQELAAFLGYSNSTERLSYWRTYSGLEVDAVLGDAKVAIEIKSAEEVKAKHKKGLKAFSEEHPDARLILVSLDKMTRVSDGIECLYVLDFLKALWNGKIVPFTESRTR
ncbi:MAG: ATP-binding protein [Bacteroidaceae bacterium]|nr:ATP-binding protein [Bacteroidaceae bacterium]